MTAVITVTSGKAKVGQSILSTNLTRYLNQKGHRTGLLIAGAKQPVWGVEPNNIWPDIFNGHLPMDKAVHRDVFGIDLMVTKGNGNTLGGLSPQAARYPNDPTGILDAYTYLIVDITAGPSAPARACCLAANETILVLTPDTATLTASFEWLGNLSRHGFTGPADIILNQVRKPALARSIYARFRDLVQKRLDIQTNLWGTIYREDNIDSTAARLQLLTQTMPDSKLLRNIQAVGDRLLAEQPPEKQTKPLKEFWQRFMSCLRQFPAIPVPPVEQPRQTGESGEQMQSPPVYDEGAPSMNNIRPAEQGIREVTHLSTQMAAIAWELHAIRRLLETRPFGQAAPGLEPKTSPSVTIDLDFDEFIRRQQKLKKQ